MEQNLTDRPKYEVIAVVLVLLLIFAGGMFWSLANQKSAVKKQLTPSNRDELGLRNADFAQGNKLINDNPSEALKAYQKALSAATDESDIDSIKFRIAFATYKSGYASGNTSEGIALFKGLVASASTSKVSKAYAIQFLTQEWFGTNDQKLFNEIFSGEPYATFLQNSAGDKDKALQQLIAYGASFFKLPMLVLRLADYKANDLLVAQNEADKSRILTEIKEYVSQAEKGIASLKSPNTSLLPVIYNRQVVLFGKLALAGFPVGNPADAFTKGINTSELYDDKDTPLFLHLNYAIFLAKQDKVGQEDTIKELLKDIYSEADINRKIFKYLKNGASAKDSAHDDIVLLSTVDSKFKDMLVKLGWKF